MSDIQQLHERFNAAYRELRAAWLKTGGGMDLTLKIRDAEAEAAFRRRSAATKSAQAKRRERLSRARTARAASPSFSPNFDERNGIR